MCRDTQAGSQVWPESLGLDLCVGKSSKASTARGADRQATGGCGRVLPPPPGAEATVREEPLQRSVRGAFSEDEFMPVSSRIKALIIPE